MISSSEVPDKAILSCKPTSSKLLEQTLLEKFISIVMFIIDSTTALRAFPCLCLTKGFPNVSDPNEPFDRTKSKINTIELSQVFNKLYQSIVFIKLCRRIRVVILYQSIVFIKLCRRIRVVILYQSIVSSN